MPKMSDASGPRKIQNVFSVLLAGGAGSRLWPVSRELYPKQLVKFIGEDSLVQMTIKRIEPLLDTEKVRIICCRDHFHETARHMENIGIDPDGKIICEPCGRNTAPAILLALLHILKDHEDPVLCVFPADHVIRNVDTFRDKLTSAITLAGQGYIVTFGIPPDYPETGYGYVEGGAAVSLGAFKIRRFIEKPEIASAKEFIDAGNFFWNSGMFAFRASVMMEEFKAHQPDMFRLMKQIVSREDIPEKSNYEMLPDISIDHAIMEKTEKGVVLPSEFGWSDIGSWKSLYDFLPKDDMDNVIDGDVIVKDTKNSLILGRKRLIATNAIRNMIVVDTSDSIFVSDLENSRDVKFIVSSLKEKGREEYQKHRKVNHPWGSFTILEKKEDYQIIRMVIHPGLELEVQTDVSDFKRLDVLKGSAEVLLNRRKRMLRPGESISIPENMRASVKNCGQENLSIIKICLKI